MSSKRCKFYFTAYRSVGSLCVDWYHCWWLP